MSLTPQRDLLASLGSGGGLLSWKSSPHFLWLACQLAQGAPV